MNRNASNQPETPMAELGLLLLKKGVIEPRDLDLALHYQKKMAVRGKPRRLDETLVELGLVEASVVEQIYEENRASQAGSASSGATNALDEFNDEEAQARTRRLERQVRIAGMVSQITQQLATAPNRYELFRLVTNGIVAFRLADGAAVFTLNEAGTQANLEQASLPPDSELAIRGFSLPVGGESGVGWAAAHRRTWVEGKITPKSTDRVAYLLPDSRSQACVPFSNRGQVLGILHVQSASEEAFDPELISGLETLGEHLAALLEHVRELEASQWVLGELSLLYQFSQNITRASNSEELLRLSAKTLKQAPFASAVYVRQGGYLSLLAAYEPGNKEANPPSTDNWSYPYAEIETYLLKQEEACLVSKEDIAQNGKIPKELRALAGQLNTTFTAFIPVRRGERLSAVFALGSNQPGALNIKSLSLYVGLASLASSALEKLQALERLERRLERLEIIDSVSRMIAQETELDKLYRTIHAQIRRVMGEVNFLIALYEPASESIEIPYAYEENQVISIPSFQLGEGLTSILIRSRQPLMLVEDTERRAQELGARVIGAPAKSWLGVPLLLGGEPIGAIIVQDLQREHRFDEDDQQLLSVLANQVAIALRNARLIREARAQAQREAVAKQITNQLWSAVDVEAILRTALGELGKAMQASKGLVTLELENPLTSPQNNKDEGKDRPSNMEGRDNGKHSQEEGRQP